MDEFDWVTRNYTVSSYGSLNNIPDTTESKKPVTDGHDRGSFASFICHVCRLENKLRGFSPIVLNNSSNVRVTDKILGRGKTFLVRHAFWVKDPSEPPVEAALKEIIPDFQVLVESSRYYPAILKQTPILTAV